mmetsp:Transcript_106546/g.282465  ORF Transcript_106546/g.282465 Transcript_106546/m.282465 type:complete len:648 (+) Transcript_106546:116-2059(+)
MAFLDFACVPLSCQGSDAAALVAQVFSSCSAAQLPAAPPAPAPHQQQQPEQELQQFGKPFEQEAQGKTGAREFGGLGHGGSGCGAADQTGGGTGHHGGSEGGRTTSGIGGHSDEGEVASASPAGQFTEKDVGRRGDQKTGGGRGHTGSGGGEQEARGINSHGGCEIASATSAAKVGEKACSQVAQAAPGGVESSSVRKQGHGKAQPQSPTSEGMEPASTASAVPQLQSPAVEGLEPAATASSVSVAAVPGSPKTGGAACSDKGIGQSLGKTVQQCGGGHRSGTVACPMEAAAGSSGRAGAVEAVRGVLGQANAAEASPIGSSRGEGAMGGLGDSWASGIVGLDGKPLPRPPASDGGHARQEVRQGTEANESFAKELWTRTRDWDAKSEPNQVEGYHTDGYEEQYFPEMGKDKGKGEEKSKTKLKGQVRRAPRGAASVMAAAASWGKLEESRRGGDEVPEVHLGPAVQVKAVSGAPRGTASVMAAAASRAKCVESRRGVENVSEFYLGPAVQGKALGEQEAESVWGPASGEETEPQDESEEEQTSSQAGVEEGPGAESTHGEGVGSGSLRVPVDLQEAISCLEARRTGGEWRNGFIDLAAVEILEELQDEFGDMASFHDCQRLLASAAEWLMEMQRPGHGRGWSNEVA